MLMSCLQFSVWSNLFVYFYLDFLKINISAFILVYLFSVFLYIDFFFSVGMLSVGTSYITMFCINYLFCACGIELNFFPVFLIQRKRKG